MEIVLTHRIHQISGRMTLMIDLLQTKRKFRNELQLLCIPLGYFINYCTNNCIPRACFLGAVQMNNEIVCMAMNYVINYVVWLNHHQ